ncbi:MAG TPA: PQQ-binding-like beta-propeller repeat protein [Gammaproteobacteria bacterium]|nr:PQQ-binding-like beta-propeller repeat protein [Gammaproteobacteria bacterium]
MRALREAPQRLAVSLLAALSSAAAVHAQTSGQARPVAPAFEAERLASSPKHGWPTNGGNLYNQRYSPLADIDRGNVARLQGVWRTRLGGSGLAPQYSGEAQPIVYEGVLYVSTGADDVFALSVASGEILWVYHAELEPGLTTVCCGWTNRGVAIGDGKVFVGRLDGRLVALDQRTGEPVWSVQAERWQEGFSITSAPLYVDGKVVTGFSGAEFGVRGRVKAFDADDGKLLWTFYTIPGPGEKGHETWPADGDIWKKGGATVWQTPAYDPELGLLYFSTGNPGPDFNGAVRAGDNLYTASIVAVDAKTGEYRWHYQQVHHDLWDYDSPNPVVLFDARIDGRMRRGLVQVSKTGWAYILDRETGEPLIGIDERPVPQEPRQATAATQPYPRGDAIVPQSIDIPPEGFELVNGGRIFTPFFGSEGRAVSPSLYGGANWPPSSYDPERHLLFVCASDVVGNYKADADLETPADGEHFEGSVVGFAPLPRTGIFAALDVTTNRLAWRYRWNDQCYSGSVATAGGVVFVGRNDGRLTALDSDTGRTLWSFKTGAGVNAPASVFEYEGREYVAVLSAGNVLVGTPHGDSVWLFALDGGLGPARDLDTAVAPSGAEGAQAADGQGAAGEGAATAAVGAAPNAAAGKAVFERTCVPCHGEDGLGGHGGGAPLDQIADAEAAITTITGGLNNMPAFGGALSDEEIRDVAAYIVTDLFPK